MNTKQAQLINIGFIVSIALVVGLFIVKPMTWQQPKSLTFVAEQVVVSQPAKIKANPVQPKTVSPKILPIVPPQIISRLLPKYPLTALEKGLEGTVLLSVFVGLNGKPGSIKIKSSSGRADFDQAALGSVKQWQFSSASQAGQAISSQIELPVKFVLN